MGGDVSLADLEATLATLSRSAQGRGDAGAGQGRHHRASSFSHASLSHSSRNPRSRSPLPPSPSARSAFAHSPSNQSPSPSARRSPSPSARSRSPAPTTRSPNASRGSMHARSRSYHMGPTFAVPTAAGAVDGAAAGSGMRVGAGGVSDGANVGEGGGTRRGGHHRSRSINTTGGLCSTGGGGEAGEARAGGGGPGQSSSAGTGSTGSSLGGSSRRFLQRPLSFNAVQGLLLSRSGPRTPLPTCTSLLFPSPLTGLSPSPSPPMLSRSPNRANRSALGDADGEAETERGRGECEGGGGEGVWKGRGSRGEGEAGRGGRAGAGAALAGAEGMGMGLSWSMGPARDAGRCCYWGGAVPAAAAGAAAGDGMEGDAGLLAPVDHHAGCCWSSCCGSGWLRWVTLVMLVTARDRRAGGAGAPGHRRFVSDLFFDAPMDYFQPFLPSPANSSVVSGSGGSRERAFIGAALMEDTGACSLAGKGCRDQGISIRQGDKGGMRDSLGGGDIFLSAREAGGRCHRLHSASQKARAAGSTRCFPRAIRPGPAFLEEGGRFRAPPLVRWAHSDLLSASLARVVPWAQTRWNTARARSGSLERVGGGDRGAAAAAAAVFGGAAGSGATGSSAGGFRGGRERFGFLSSDFDFDLRTGPLYPDGPSEPTPSAETFLKPDAMGVQNARGIDERGGEEGGNGSGGSRSTVACAAWSRCSRTPVTLPWPLLLAAAAAADAASIVDCSSAELPGDAAAAVAAFAAAAAAVAAAAPAACERTGEDIRTPGGSVLGRGLRELKEVYVVGRAPVGRGQYGTVRKCVHRGTGKAYACKSIGKRSLLSAAEKEAVRREVGFLERLKGHANIIRMKETIESTRHVHIIMEHCEGGDLLDRIQLHRNFPEPSAARIFRSLMRALQHCHAHGIVHRDSSSVGTSAGMGASSCNFSSDAVKLIDFGVATLYSPEKPCRDVIGTSEYMAPEVFDQSYGPESDVWSAGIVLIHAGDWPSAVQRPTLHRRLGGTGGEARVAERAGGEGGGVLQRARVGEPVGGMQAPHLLDARQRPHRQTHATTSARQPSPTPDPAPLAHPMLAVSNLLHSFPIPSPSRPHPVPIPPPSRPHPVPQITSGYL
ncbi:unnamed protein product [Closterium sp. Naga37s-1]|nr:unnamed protein product [Closterium sp. Naga37s-1]